MRPGGTRPVHGFTPIAEVIAHQNLASQTDRLPERGHLRISTVPLGLVPIPAVIGGGGWRSGERFFSCSDHRPVIQTRPVNRAPLAGRWRRAPCNSHEEKT